MPPKPLQALQSRPKSGRPPARPAKPRALGMSYRALAKALGKGPPTE